MIASNSKRMSRLEIIYTVVANTVKLMHRLSSDELIPKEMEHYLDPEDHNKVIHYCKNKDVSTCLNTAVQNAVSLKGILSADECMIFPNASSSFVF